MADHDQVLDFTGSPVAQEFYYSNGKDDCIVGPVMSGKSYAMFSRAFRHVLEQPPGTDGISHTKILVLRHSYRALKDTAVVGYEEVFRPEIFGHVAPTGMEHKTRFKIAGYDYPFELHTLFRAADDQAAIRGFLSLNLSFALVNELRECDAEVYGMLRTRCDRFPNNPPPKFSGIISDSNPWHDDAWQHKMFVLNPAPGTRLFLQPAGLIKNPDGVGWVENPRAENRKHRRPGYYTNAIIGMPDEESQRVYLRSEWGSLRGQRPVATYFNDALHVREFEPVAGLPFSAGIDPGLNAATVVGQSSADGFRIFMEVTTDGTPLGEHLELVKREFSRLFPGQQLRIAYIDPAGDQRNAQTGQTTTQAARAVFSPTVVMPAPGNNEIALRIDSLQNALRQNNTRAEPMFLLHKRCTKLRKALQSGWRYKEMKGSGGQYESKPYKLDDASHIADALCYFILGGGGCRGAAGGVDQFAKDCAASNSQKQRGKPWNVFHD